MDIEGAFDRYTQPGLFQANTKSPDSHAGSVLLALFHVMPNLLDHVLRPYGGRILKRSRVRCLTDIRLKDGDTPIDGIIEISNSSSRWLALVDWSHKKEDAETLVGAAQKIDADLVLQFTADAGWEPENPKSTDKLQHVRLSFARIADILRDWKSSETVTDETHIILIDYYLSLLGNDALAIDRLSSLSRAWSGDLSALENLDANTYRTRARDVLSLQDELGRVLKDLIQVDIGLKIANAQNREKEFQSLADQVSQGACSVSFNVYGLVSPIIMKLDFVKKRIDFEMMIDAPKNRDLAGQVSWLLHMILSDDPRYCVSFEMATGQDPFCVPLCDLRKDPQVYTTGGAAVTGFRITMQGAIGTAFQHRTRLLQHAVAMLPLFYQEVGLRLRPWIPTPPPIIGEFPSVEVVEKPVRKRRKKAEKQTQPMAENDTTGSQSRADAETVNDAGIMPDAPDADPGIAADQEPVTAEATAADDPVGEAQEPETAVDQEPAIAETATVDDPVDEAQEPEAAVDQEPVIAGAAAVDDAVSEAQALAETADDVIEAEPQDNAGSPEDAEESPRAEDDPAQASASSNEPADDTLDAEQSGFTADPDPVSRETVGVQLYDHVDEDIPFDADDRPLDRDGGGTPFDGLLETVNADHAEHDAAFSHGRDAHPLDEQGANMAILDELIRESEGQQI